MSEPIKAMGAFTHDPVDVLVVGSGPAGIAAAAAAAAAGAKTLLLDDNCAPGGQIWRATTQGGRVHGRARERALAHLKNSGAAILANCRVFDARPGEINAIVEGPSRPSTTLRVRYQNLVLATGARERFLPFPGWTLPGVFGVGGLQALSQSGFVLANKRVVIAGSGPLLLAAAAHLRQVGARVTLVAEQSPVERVRRFAFSLWSSPAKLWQGACYRASLPLTRFRYGCWPIAALTGPDHTLRAVRLSNSQRIWEEPCDLLACGFHLIPNLELAVLLGCRIENGCVWVDRRQQTSERGVFAAGETTGVAGLEAALIEGELAGRSAAGMLSPRLESRIRHLHAFARMLNEAFAPRPELAAMPAADTVVCRCEDVRFAELSKCDSWTEAKLTTRCGMGPCQGRICGPAAEVLFGWRPASVRPPIFPVPLEALCMNMLTNGEGA